MAKMKLTPLSRLLIVVALAVGAYFLLRNYIPALQGGGGDTTEETATENNANTETTTTQPETTTPPKQEESRPTNTNTNTTSSFTYTPAAPVNGKLRGVVELGASGFNSFIVNMDKNKNWKLQKADWGNSLVYDGMASGKDISSGLKAFIGDMLDYGVSGKEIHFVVSSGAMKVAETQKIIAELKKMGYVVNTVTPEQEGTYALKASLPNQYKGSSFMVDIGSGNTKISWADGANIKALESYGAKYYKDNVDDKTAYNDVRKVAGSVPSGRTRTCFMLGGVPFKMAKEVRKGDERYTVLKSPTSYKLDGAKNEAGLNIYKALADGTGCDTFVFDWEGNFTIGFLLSL